MILISLTSILELSSDFMDMLVPMPDDYRTSLYVELASSELTCNGVGVQMGPQL